MLVPSVALPSNYLSSTALRLLLCFLAVWFLTEPVNAQEGDDDVVRVSTDLSVFPIRVRSRKQNQPPTLSANDFQLKDNDGITSSLYFSAGAERVAIVFALDESGSLRDLISQQRDAALALLGRFGQNSRVAVIRFSQRPKIEVPFSNDPAAAQVAFDFRARPNSRTAIFDAAASAVRLFESSIRDPAERRIVILISDGLDNSSLSTSSQIIAEAQNKNVSFYMIQVPLFEPRDGHLAVRGPSKGFKELAAKTGGMYFVTADAKSALSPVRDQDLSSVFRAIEDDLKSQYVVGFYVSEKGRDDRAHNVSITLTRPSVEYSLAQYGFSKTHNFSVKLPRGTND
jgi:Ca-activated chloride channel homolog